MHGKLERLHIHPTATVNNALVLGPVRVGAHAVVAAGSLVREDVAPYTVAAGRPAKAIKKVDSQ